MKTEPNQPVQPTSLRAVADEGRSAKMKNRIRLALLIVGIIGFIAALPMAVFVWIMRGALSPDEKSILALYCFVLPGAALASIFASFILRRQITKEYSESNAARNENH
jgi:O-antigen/teichoic acid export membrane protein